MHNIYILRMSICGILLMIFTLIRQIHIIQLNSYNLDQQILWYKKNKVSLIINVVLLIFTLVYYKLNFLPAYVVIIVSLLGILIENIPRKQKKKLVYTARIKRLIFVSVILLFLFYLPLIIFKNEKYVEVVLYGIALSPFVIFLAYLIMLPVENEIRKKFMREANKIISENDNLYTVGITGSYGKTSTKYYLSSILRAKYNVCITPESYNTAMGATLTIKNELRNIDDIFICEMGARRVGDVKEICDIVNPCGAILTDVGNMHLDTFYSIENVRKCKFELIDAVNKEKNLSNKIVNKKNVLINGDNELIIEKIKQYEFGDKELWTYGFLTTNDFYAKNIKADASGVKFDVVCNMNNEKKFISFETKLLGNYNIKNLVAAIAYAILLNVPIDVIVEQVKKISAVAHRLQLMSYDSNCLMIDDAYNSNPKGAKNAVDALSVFNGYKKIIITPGMVELGNVQRDENREFAKYASEKVDIAIVVGNTNKEALKDGFSNKLGGDNLLFIDKVEEAILFARNNIEGKKVVLLENDLSDNY